jgi:hypothetical protein
MEMVLLLHGSHGDSDDNKYNKLPRHCSEGRYSNVMVEDLFTGLSLEIEDLSLLNDHWSRMASAKRSICGSEIRIWLGLIFQTLRAGSTTKQSVDVRKILKHSI